MIRVNLLRNVGLATAGTSMGTSMGGELVSVDVRRQAAIKAAIVCLFPLLLYIWENLRINTLESERTQLQQRVDTVEAERASFGSAGPRVDKANKLKAKIEKEIKVIRELAKNRLREVKALDQLQSVLPAGTWVREIEMSGGKIALAGFAINETAVTDLLTALNSNLFFSSVSPRGTRTVQNSALGQVTEFNVEFRVGRQEE